MYPKFKIEFMSSSEESTRIVYQSAQSEVNVSNALQVFEAGNSNFSKKGFQLSPVSPLNGQYTFFTSEGYSGYLSSGSTGQISFYVYNEIPDELYITFDPASGEYAPSYKITNNQNGNVVTMAYNTTVTSRIPITSLNVTPGVILTLTILTWSVANKSAKVTSISGHISSYEATGASLIDFKCSENLMDSELSVSPGICEQYASVRIYDRDSFFKNRALEGALERDAQVTLSAVDTNEVEHILGTYLVSDWGIDSNSSTITINCHDKSHILSKINIPRAEVANRSVDTLLNIMFSYATNMPWEYLDAATRTRCTNIEIPNCWWLASDLYTMLNKICSVGMLRIYWYIDRFIVGRCV